MYLSVHLTSGTGAGTDVPVMPFTEISVWVPASRGAAVSGAYETIQWPIMLAVCMTIHRVQGVGFGRVAIWIPSRGFFAEGQGYTAVSRAETPEGASSSSPQSTMFTVARPRTSYKTPSSPPLRSLPPYTP